MKAKVLVKQFSQALFPSLNPAQRLLPAIAFTAVFALSGCGGGAGTEANPNLITNGGSGSSGIAAATDDVQAFKLNVWDNIKANNRCGGCHNAGGQAPEFARSDDVNLAYSAAITVTNIASPQDSRLVTKVAAGHNCWESSDLACADILTRWISAWVNGTSGISSKKINLRAPEIKDVGQSKGFPADSSLFAANVHPLLTQYCAACHSDTASTPQSPYFAQADADTAYAEARTKIDLDTTSNSRLVVRVRDEFHNCWSGNCANDGQQLLDAINAMANAITPTQINPQLVASKALRLADGIVASGGARHEANVIALYEFKTGSGTTAFDTSGVEPAMNLSFQGDIGWVGGYGVEFRNATARAQATTATSKKLYDFISASGEYTIEAWMVPNNVNQDNANIIGYSAGDSTRNFTLSQNKYQLEYRNRSTNTDANGDTLLITDADDEDAHPALQHLVATYDPVRGRRLYINGVYTDDADAVSPGALSNWNDSYVFILGNEAGGGRPWRGMLRMVAIHNRALTQEQITQNFQVGVGEKYFLLFSVSHLINVPDSYVYFEVSQFDSYSYLFNKPTFISLDPSATPSNIAIKGIRIGINGKELDVGQAYRNLDTTLDAASGYTADTGQLLSSIGTVVASDKGVDSDEFFLTFAQLGSNTNTYVEATPVAAAPTNLPAASDIGIRTFDEINASLASLTDVPTNEGLGAGGVADTYATVKQQLPPVEDIQGFLSANNIGITQLAVAYCDALAEDRGNTSRASYFPGFNFGESYTTAFNTSTKRNLIINPLVNRLIGSTDLASQPLISDIQNELHSLMDTLDNCVGSCGADPTGNIVKAACAAAFGSAAMLIQ